MTPTFVQRCHMGTRGVRGGRRGDHRASQHPRADSKPEPSHHEFTPIIPARTAARQRTSCQNKSRHPGSRYIGHVALAPRTDGTNRQAQDRWPMWLVLNRFLVPQVPASSQLPCCELPKWIAVPAPVTGGRLMERHFEIRMAGAYGGRGSCCGARRAGLSGRSRPSWRVPRAGLSFLDALSAHLVNQIHISRHANSPLPLNLTHRCLPSVAMLTEIENCDHLT